MSMVTHDAPTTSRSGFTVVEILVSVFVFVLIVAMATSMIRALVRANDESTNLLAADEYASSVIEEIRNSDYASVSTATISSDLPSTLPQPRTATQTVSQHTTTIKRVLIEINYGDPATTRTYETFVSEHGA